MIFDFRMRPPFKSWTSMGGLFGPQGGLHVFPLSGRGTPAPSADKMDMKEFFKEMDEAGITKGCLIGRRSSGDWVGGVKNEDIYELCQQYPDKFIGIGGIDTSNSIDEQLADVDKCAREYKFRGMMIETANSPTPMYADNRKFFPFYEKCAELGLIVVLVLSPFVGPNETYASAVPVQNVAKAFPKGKFVVVHGGYPDILPSVIATITTPNMWIVPDFFWEYPFIPGRDLYTQACMLSQGVKFIFAASYPFISMGQAVQEMKNLNLPEKVYNRVMWENAKELLDF